MWVSVLVSDCPPDLVKPKLDDNIINVCEENPPEGIEGLDWFILTTIPVNTIEDAE